MSKLEELRQRNVQALKAGGEERIEAQHKAGKKTARERISALLDDASFVEIDKFIVRAYATPGFEAVSETGEGVVCGYGTVDERPVFLFAQDYTVLSGSLSVAHAQKILKTMDMAERNGMPIIGLLDSDGARISEGIAAVNSYAAILKKLSDLSGVVPTITVVAGNCIGTAAYIAASTDFCFMTEGISVTALHGTQIYASARGEDLDDIKLQFGAQMHNESTGIAQFLARDEEDCFAQVKKLISFLPLNNLECAPYSLSSDDLNRQIVAGEGVEYNPVALIAAIADNGDLLEYQALYSPEIVTAFGRLNGGTVGFVANCSDGKITGHAARKATRFLSILDAYSIPVVTLTNCGGTDVENERPMDMANYARLACAYAQAGVPMLNVITGKAVGDGYAVMCPKALGADIVYAWPEAQITSLPTEAGALVMYEDEIAKAEDGMAAKQQMIAKYTEEYANPWQAAAQGAVDDVIEPASTRQMLIAALEMCISKREEKPAKKHNVLPL